MLNNYYATEDEIPENLKGAYAAKNGRYELDQLDSSHPAIVAKNEIQQKHDAVRNGRQEDINKIARLEGSSMPEGKVAVDPEIEKLGNAAKEAKLKASEIPTLKGQSETLQKQIDLMQSDSATRKAISAVGLDADKFMKLKGEREINLSSSIEEKDGKKTESFFVQHKDAKGIETKTDLAEYLRSDDHFGSFFDDLKLADAEKSKTWVDQKPSDGKKLNTNIYDGIRQQKADEQKADAKRVSFAEQFSGAKTATN